MTTNSLAPSPSRRSLRDSRSSPSRSNPSSNGVTETKSPQPDGTDSLAVSGLFKRFGSVEALKNVSLSAPRGTFMALLGPSGSGKTTLLRILGGLEQADAGNVVFDNLDWLHVPSR